MKGKKCLKVSLGMMICIVIIVILVIAFLGLGTYTYQLKNKQTQTNAQAEDVINTNRQENQSKKIDETQNYIYEKDKTEIKEMISYGGSYQEEYTDTISLPYININSEDAQKINQTLEEQYQKASTSLHRESESTFDYSMMRYKSNLLEGKLVSLETETSDIHVPGGGFEVKYKIYNMDLNTGKQLSNLEVLQMLNWNEVEFVTKLKEEIEGYFYQYGYEMGYQSLQEFLATCDISNYQMFVLNEKQIDAYVPCDGIPEGDSNLTFTIDL